MDHLMTLEQWRLMKENHEKEEPKEIVVEDIDDKELKKMNLGYQKPLLKPDNEEKKEKQNENEGDSEEDDQKECSIF